MFIKLFFFNTYLLNTYYVFSGALAVAKTKTLVLCSRSLPSNGRECKQKEELTV